MKATSAVERRVILALRTVAVVLLVTSVVWRISSLAPTDRFFDDFFYYLKTAQNWVDGAGSTFFPGEPTNGYHPLWFLWLASVYSAIGNGAAFFAAVDLSVLALLLGFYLLFDRFLARATRRAFAGTAGATVALFAIAPKALMGLETALVVCVAAALLVFLTRKPIDALTLTDAALVGLLGAAMVLARLDSVMLAPGLLCAVIPCWDWRRYMAVAAGATPLYMYFAFNMYEYGEWGTTSMTAKSLGFYFPPNWHFVAVELPARGAAEIGMIVVAVLVVALRRRIADSDIRRVALALTAAPLLQLGAQALLSGWKLYPWYLYFDYMAMGLTVSLVVAPAIQRSAVRYAAIAGGSVGLVLVMTWFSLSIRPDRDQVGIAQIGRDLATFSAKHPGVYAMGDSAGTPSWLMDQPMVHLEGLMMSPEFLERIRQQQSLQEVFRHYRVNYYVAVRSSGSDSNGCPKFLEPSPSQSSWRAPHLSMTICAQPVSRIYKPGYYNIRIFKVDPSIGAIL